MTRVVYRGPSRGRASDSPYHLFDDCHYLEQAAGPTNDAPLDSLWDDLSCCRRCIKRAFVYKSGCSHCDGPHELDPTTLDAEMVVWECPKGGFADTIGSAIFEQQLISAGISRADVHDVVDGIVADGGERR